MQSGGGGVLGRGRSGEGVGVECSSDGCEWGGSA